MMPWIISFTPQNMGSWGSSHDTFYTLRDSPPAILYFVTSFVARARRLRRLWAAKLASRRRLWAAKLASRASSPCPGGVQKAFPTRIPKQNVEDLNSAPRFVAIMLKNGSHFGPPFFGRIAFRVFKDDSSSLPSGKN